MKILAIDLAGGVSVNSPDISVYFNILHSSKSAEVFNDNLSKKFGICIPPPNTYTLGLLSIASSLKYNGHYVSYYIYKNTEESVNGLLSHFAVDIAIFSCKTVIFSFALDLAKKLKTLNPSIITIFGGPHPSSLPDEVVSEEFVDYVVVGEGEFTVNHLVEAITAGVAPTEIKGVYFKYKDKSIHQGKPPELIDDINKIPEIDYHLLSDELNNYNLYLETARGCYFNCSFCANPFLWKRKVRSYNATKVYKRLKELEKVLKPNTLIHVVDPSFGNSPDSNELCKMLENNPINLKFSCDICAVHVTSERIKKMYNAGIRIFYLGIENVDENILKINHKPGNFELVKKACEIIKSNTDALVKTYWIVGLPGETESSASKNRDAAIWMLKSKLTDLVEVDVFVANPGCDVYFNNEKYDYKISHKNWTYYNSYAFPYPGEMENFSMERIFIEYIDFLRALCEFYKISNREALRSYYTKS